MIRPDIFDIESDWLDRKLMDFAPEPNDPLLIDDQSLEDLLAEADDLLAEMDSELSGDMMVTSHDSRRDHRL